MPEDTQGGYQSGPDELEHSSILPIVVEMQHHEPMIIGKKRQRRRSEKKNKDANADKSSAGVSSRKKKVITNCEHTDREFYARGMCKNCYHKKGRVKRAECCPDKMMYSRSLCQNCYMKQYGKERRRENRNARAAAKALGAEASHEQSSDKPSSSKVSVRKEQSATKRPRVAKPRAGSSAASERDMTAPTLNVRPDGNQLTPR